MGYIYAVLAVFSGSVKGYCGKKTSDYTKDMSDAMLFNSIRMIFCVIIGFAISVLSGGFVSLLINKSDILSIVLSGIFSSLFVATWLVNVKSGVYVMLDVFLSLGVIVPLIGGRIFFSEKVSLKQWLGMAILLAATMVLCSYNNKIKVKIKPAYLGMLILCGFCSGMSDFSQKIFAQNKSGTKISTFNLYSYLISFFLLAFLYFVSKKIKSEKPSFKMPKKVFLYVLIMSVFLFANSFMQTLAASYLSSAQLFPLTRSLALIFSAIMAALFFNEKITPRCVLGMVLAFLGIFVINF